MILVNMTPSAYETIILALNLALETSKRHDTKHLAKEFEEALHEIAPQGTKSKEVGKRVDKN